jgi:hypothetical protein
MTHDPLETHNHLHSTPTACQLDPAKTVLAVWRTHEAPHLAPNRAPDVQPDVQSLLANLPKAFFVEDGELSAFSLFVCLSC